MLLKLEQWPLNVWIYLVHMVNDLGMYLQLTNSGMFMGKLSGSESSKALEVLWRFFCSQYGQLEESALHSSQDDSKLILWCGNLGSQVNPCLSTEGEAQLFLGIGGPCFASSPWVGRQFFHIRRILDRLFRHHKNCEQFYLLIWNECPFLFSPATNISFKKCVRLLFCVCAWLFLYSASIS